MTLAFLIILPLRAIREQQAVPANQATAYPPQGSWKESCCTSLLLSSFLSASQGTPQSSYVGDTKTVSHFALPERVPCMWHLQQTQDSRPRRTLEPDVRAPLRLSCYCSRFLIRPCACLRLAAPCSSSLLCCRQPAADRAGPFSPSVIFFPPAAGFGCYLCRLDHQRPTTHSQ